MPAGAAGQSCHAVALQWIVIKLLQACLEHTQRVSISQVGYWHCHAQCTVAWCTDATAMYLHMKDACSQNSDRL